MASRAGQMNGTDDTGGTEAKLRAWVTRQQSGCPYEGAP